MQTQAVSFQRTKAPHFYPLRVSSPAFTAGGRIPGKYTCHGYNISPPLHIDHIPAAAKSMVIVTSNLRYTKHHTQTQWIVWNVPVTHRIKEGSAAGVRGLNSYNRHTYDGPCPCKGKDVFDFKVYAVDCVLNISPESDRGDLEKAIAGHVLAVGAVTGTYEARDDLNLL